MKNRLIFLLFSLPILVSTRSLGEEQLGLDLVRYMVNIYGKCIGAKLAGTVVTSKCQGVVVDVAYLNGRRNLIGMLGEGEMLITFSGTKETNPMPDKYELQLDRVTLASRNRPVEEVAGSGRCTVFGKLSEGLTILCLLKTHSGNYELAFLGNGNVKWEKKKISSP